MEKEHLTKGEFYANSGQIYTAEKGNTIALIPYYDKDSQQDKANADLIAEAFNVHDESGLTPRELLAKNEQLTQALVAVKEWLLPDKYAHEDGIISIINNSLI